MGGTPEPYPAFESALELMDSDKKAVKGAEGFMGTMHAIVSAGADMLGEATPELADELDKMAKDADLSSYLEKKVPPSSPFLLYHLLKRSICKRA